MEKPFWEQTYADENAATFSKEPTADLNEFAHLIRSVSRVLDVGCGEGRNAIFLAKQGHSVDAFDLSAAGIAKARAIAQEEGAVVRFSVCDMKNYVFEHDYDVILSHGVLHLPERAARDAFLLEMQRYTRPDGYHFIGVFTNRLPATPDNAPFTKSLFDVGELPEKYAGWKIIHHMEGIFQDEHPGGIRHEHAYERIIAQKIQHP